MEESLWGELGGVWCCEVWYCEVWYCMGLWVVVVRGSGEWWLGGGG